MSGKALKDPGNWLDGQARGGQCRAGGVSSEHSSRIHICSFDLS